ncbi:MAG: hypothetical protein M3507_09860 [Actinomycetota bacterium]|nr:hypothetical protein [Actinomycetota bacterium]
MPSPPPPDIMSIAELDRLVARYLWLERRRFEVLGAWATSTPEVDVVPLLATQAHHHAWHASLWERHLPRRSGYEASGDAPVSEALRIVVDEVAGPSGPDATVARLVGAFRVLAPRVVASYSSQLTRASAVSGGAFARTCRLVLADQHRDGRDGEQVLQGLLDTDERIERAARHQAELESHLRAAGGISG